MNSSKSKNTNSDKIIIYGEGKKGKVINNKGLYNILADREIKNIKLVGLEKTKVLEKEDFKKFFDLLYNDNSYVVKVFKNKNTSQNFKNECKGIKNIYRIFKDSYKKYTTLYFLEFNNFKSIGFKITCNNNYKIYVVLNSMCDMSINKFNFTNYSIFNKFIENTLSALVKLQEYKYAHTDLKTDNIIYCNHDDRFKIIDWEMSKILSLSINISSQYYANIEHNSPLAFYINGKSMDESIKYFKKNNIKKKQKWFESEQFQIIFNMYVKELYNIKDKYVFSKIIFEKYKYHLDLFAIATIYYKIMYTNNLDITEDYIELFTKMISLNGLINAENAYKYFKSKF